MISPQQFLTIIFQANQISKYIGGQELSFNQKISKVEIVNRGGGKNGCKTRWIALIVFSFINIVRVVLLNVCKLQTSKDLNREVESSLCFMVFLMGFVTGTRYRIWTYSPQTFMNFLNGIIEINRDYLKDVPLPEFPKSNYVYLVLRVTGVLCTWIFPYCVPICCVLEKSMPFNAMWLPDRLLDMIHWEFPYIVGNGLTLAVNYLIWRMIAKQAYCLAADILVGVVSLTLSHEMANRNLLHGLEQSLFTEGNPSNISPNITACRATHLLVELYNGAINSQLLVLMFGCGVSEVASAVILIKQSASNDLPFFLKIFFVVLTVQAFVGILGLYGFAGDFHQISERSLSKLNQQVNKLHLGNISRKERKFREKLVRSFQVQKVKFGLSNYVEKTTPAVFQLFCLERIIDLLLVK